MNWVKEEWNRGWKRQDKGGKGGGKYGNKHGGANANAQPDPPGNALAHVEPEIKKQRFDPPSGFTPNQYSKARSKCLKEKKCLNWNGLGNPLGCKAALKAAGKDKCNYEDVCLGCGANDHGLAKCPKLKDFLKKL